MLDMRTMTVHHFTMADPSTKSPKAAGIGARETARVMFAFLATALAGFGIIAALVWLGVILLLAATGI